MVARGVPKIFLLAGMVVFALFSMVKSDDTCDIEIENTLKTLLSPQEYPSMQLQALRKDMLRRFQEALDRTEEEDEMNYKRSLSSLAQWDNLPTKRNLEALARAGLVRTLPTDDDDDPSNKRSNDDKQGQPGFQINDEKRGIQSLARNGDLHTKKEIEEMLEELHNKRTIDSLARNYNFPSYGKRYLGALVRNGDYQYGGKRNIASIAREGGRFVGKRNVPETSEDKRNIASIKAQYPAKYKKSSTRAKRQAYFDGDMGEYPSPVYQNQNVDDYEELNRVLTGIYPGTEKRFLGSVARSGWFRPSSQYDAPEKRHIGALARLGWLPTLRNVRRFNRSGRSTTGDSCREAAADGQTEDDAVAQNALSLEEKRFLLQPAVDRILLRKIFMHPRTHTFIASDMS